MYYKKYFVLQNDMKFKMNGKRSLSPTNSPAKPWKQQVSQVHNGSLMEERRKLPMWSARESFLKEISKQPVVVLLAETGSGKTTQVPQFLWSAKLCRDKKVAITQPRRMAAVSLARRVAQEMGTEVGSLVGFRVRFQDQSDSSTRLLYQTDGMLLREAMLDNKLSRYSWVVLDEAHERTVNTDILFGVVKVRGLTSDLTLTWRCRPRSRAGSTAPRGR